MKDIKSLVPGDRRAWMLAGGVAAVVLMGVVLALGPVSRTFRELDAAADEQQREFDRNLRVIAPKSMFVVTNEYARFGTMIAMRGSSDEENSRMLSEVDRLAGENKVTLSATKPREQRIKDAYQENYAVTVEIEAGLSQVVSFLYALEASPQLLRVDSMSLESKGGKPADCVRGTLLISKVVTL